MSHHHHPRRILTPGASRKRKETETFYAVQPLKLTANLQPSVSAATSSKAAEPVSSNQLLAGYMAHEFLTKGTLLGQKFDPARAGAMPVSTADLKRNKPGQSLESDPSGKMKPEHQRYADVANLLKSEGTHIQGIVNPTQLTRWIQM
ncbi:unnamed protein product [Ilex paraguariensis]